MKHKKRIYKDEIINNKDGKLDFLVAPPTLSIEDDEIRAEFENATAHPVLGNFNKKLRIKLATSGEYN